MCHVMSPHHQLRDEIMFLLMMTLKHSTHLIILCIHAMKWPIESLMGEAINLTIKIKL